MNTTSVNSAMQSKCCGKKKTRDAGHLLENVVRSSDGKSRGFSVFSHCLSLLPVRLEVGH